MVAKMEHEKMIIDTESPEGQALVALAKFGERALWYMEKYPDTAIEMLLEAWALHHGIYARTDPNADGDTEYVRTDLAKLPEGL